MKTVVRNFILFLAVGLLSACRISEAPIAPVTPVVSPATTETRVVFSEAEMKTLASLQQVDDYPLYVMQYFQEKVSRQDSSSFAEQEPGPISGWACSLFTVLLDADHLLFGRNFDWEFSPALLLFTDPPDGYASVSMVDATYLGFSAETVSSLMDLPVEERGGLLGAWRYPFDGMNEYGLAIGMAAVPSGNMQADPSKPQIGSIGIIREILDHARDVDEAVELFRGYDIDYAGGPPLHYLIADAKGKAVLVEFYQGEMHVINNTQPWHSATNFLRSSVEDPKGSCWRYDRINARLDEVQGRLDSESGMDLLAEVAQDSTQWSVVYQMARREVNIAMGGDYSEVHTFRMSDYIEVR